MGFETFSEARMVTSDMAAQGIQRFIFVASDWYVWAAGPVWRARSKENSLTMEIVSVKDTGGWRTKLKYFLYGAMIRIALLVGLGFLLEKILAKVLAKRQEGFTFNGCA
jgi:YD repeat-containing protein